MDPVFERFSLQNEVAVITGGGRGIGEGIATDFARAGAKVVVAARRTNEIEAVAARIREMGGEAIAVTTDVTDSQALENLAEKTIEAFGKLTTWVNNAGGSPARMPLRELPRDEWDRTIELNLTAVYMGCMTAVAHMSKGSIINISSGAGFSPVPGSAHYGAAKAAVHSLTWTLSAELAPDIRVNAVAPGAIPTEIMLKALNKDESQLDELLDEWNIPLGRLGTPEDIGSACVYLASEASSWVSGEIIRVGGGAKPR
ncbi:MAG: glucose 1-dehydrogenase [Gammaproteobacteria bacterium]|jgi:NAD(P)-dependent dehydrogenase (short-subunit alcohol dehydrogenase family)|nr:glucose 1-dehydrogenase [Gammaproteobacteria bacterium]MBT5205023.1 glucose 1-dehydrogenase [Gammaproteobacteria bacterium]MBT5602178.1 glucose 1-dehydrogenase [Gammaproteobacteria bacterium]MBT6246141.1 glucose 1-dehydrogenase [Gammaproteobacteria bacterium]